MITKLLNIDDLIKLNKKVSSYNPDIIILASQEMIRLYQLLKKTLMFDDTKIFSNFAVPYIHSNLKNKKVIIINTTFNINIHKQINACKPAEIKYLSLLKTNSELNKEINIEYININQKSLLNIFRSLFYQNRPLEIEFPTFKLNFDNIIPKHIFNKLIKNEEWHVKDITPLESRQNGFYRFSIDINTNSTEICKFRLYIDENKNYIYYVPMISQEKYLALSINNSIFPNYIKKLFQQTELIHEKFESFYHETLFRLKMYITSMGLGFILLNKLKEILNPINISLEKEDLTILFGDKTSNILNRFFNENIENIKFHNFIKTLNDSQNNNFFCKSLKTDIKQDTYLPKTYSRSFINFFNKLDTQSSPTFSELISIMREYWKNSPAIQNISTTHILLSRLLDINIDQGFIIPSLNIYGQRTFRKGNAIPYDQYEIKTLQNWGLSIEPGDNIESILEKCSSIQRAVFYQVMWNINASYIKY